MNYRSNHFDNLNIDNGGGRSRRYDGLLLDCERKRRKFVFVFVFFLEKKVVTKERSRCLGMSRAQGEQLFF